MSSGSGDQAEQLSPELFPELLNSLEVGAWQEKEQSQACTTKGTEITVAAPESLNMPDPAGHEPGVSRLAKGQKFWGGTRTRAVPVPSAGTAGAPLVLGTALRPSQEGH